MFAKTVIETRGVPTVVFLNAVVRDDVLSCEAFFIQAEKDSNFEANPVPSGALDVVTEYGQELVINFPALEGAGRYWRERSSSGDVQFYSFEIIEEKGELNV